MKHKNIGDSFDSFLEDEGILEEVEKVAIKRKENIMKEKTCKWRGRGVGNGKGGGENRRWPDEV